MSSSFWPVCATLLLSLVVAGCSDVQRPCADALTRCNDDNVCTFDDCDANTGACIYANNDGAACERDGEATTCSAGVCGASSEAVAFCQQYETTCGFGEPNRHESEGACRASYDTSSDAKLACIEQHLGFAGAMDPNTHCPHATGQSPCNL